MNLAKSLKKVCRILAKTLVGIILFVIVYIGIEYILSNITSPAEATTESDLSIFVQTNGVHTDLVLPIKNEYYDWSTQIDISTTIANDSSAQFVAIGWGDKGFYLETPSWAELKVSTAFKAAFGLSSTAMHCTFHTNFSESENSKQITMSAAQYKRLVSFINEGFEWKSKKTILVNTKVRYDDYDTFYEASGHYSLFRTCNTWTNQALKAAGLKASYWVAFERGVMRNYLNE